MKQYVAMILHYYTHPQHAQFRGLSNGSWPQGSTLVKLTMARLRTHSRQMDH